VSPKSNHFCGSLLHICTRLHQFLTSSISVFARTETRTDAAKSSILPWRAGRLRDIKRSDRNYICFIETSRTDLSHTTAKNESCLSVQYPVRYTVKPVERNSNSMASRWRGSECLMKTLRCRIQQCRLKLIRRTNNAWQESAV